MLSSEVISLFIIIIQITNEYKSFELMFLWHDIQKKENYKRNVYILTCIQMHMKHPETI